jgi:hypothetical protein
MVQTTFGLVEGSLRGAPVLDEAEACLEPRMSKKDLLAIGSRVAELADPLKAQHVLIPPSASFRVGDGEAEVMNSHDLRHVLVAPWS